MKYFRAGKSKKFDRADSSSKVGRSEPTEGSRSGRSEARTDRADRRLLNELARKNEEVARQREQLGKLHNEVSRIAEMQSVQKKQMRSMEQDHKAELRSLQKQVEEERAVKHTIEMELTTLMDRCNELVHESKRNELEAEVNKEEDDRADNGTYCHQELSACCSTETANLSSESFEPSSHSTPPDELKKLRGHMTTLDASMREEVPFVDDEELERRQTEEYEAKTSKACSHVKKDLGRLKKWVGWKWRWAAEALRSDIESKRFEGDHRGDNSNDRPQPQPPRERNNTDRGVRSSCLGCRRSTCVCTDSTNDESGGGGGGMVPAVMTAWRAYARAVRLEKKALSMITSLEKMVSALPWWIRRVGQRRLLERCFFRWEMAALRRNKLPGQDGSGAADACTRKCSACKHDVDCKSANRKKQGDQNPTKGGANANANAASIGKPRKAWGSSNGKGEYLAWENQVRQKKGIGDYSRSSGVKKLQSLQASIQKEVRELEAQLNTHMQALKEDQNRSIAPKGPIWKGSSNSTWEICNNLVRSLADARKQLGSTDGKLKNGLKQSRKYRGGKEQLLDIPGGFQQQKMMMNSNNNNPNFRNSSPRIRSSSKQQGKIAGAEPHTVVEVPEACNLTLDPGASVNVSRPGDGKGGNGDWDYYGGRICSAAQYAEYLRDEIKRLKQWQIDHESEIRKELGITAGKAMAMGDVHPELEVCW